MEQSIQSNLTPYLVKNASNAEEAQKLLNQMDEQGYEPILMAVHDQRPLDAKTYFFYTFRLKEHTGLPAHAYPPVHK